MFNDEVAYGYCASKEKPFYGFQGHLLVAANGIPVSLSLTRVGVFFNVKAEKPAIQFENLISAWKIQTSLQGGSNNKITYWPPMKS